MHDDPADIRAMEKGKLALDNWQHPFCCLTSGKSLNLSEFPLDPVDTTGDSQVLTEHLLYAQSCEKDT